MSTSGFIFTGRSGCFLPTLIVLNLFFGKLIFGSNSLWLAVEGLLVLVFIIKIHLFARKIREQLWPGGGNRSEGRGLSSASQNHNPQGKVVDIQGQVVEDGKELK
jgi:hypothetical protein